MISITPAPIIQAGQTIPYERRASARAGSRGIAPQYRSTIEASGRTTVATEGYPSYSLDDAGVAG